MHVDSDIGYIGEYYNGYNYDAYYLQFGSDLDMLEIMTIKNVKNSQELSSTTTPLGV